MPPIIRLQEPLKFTVTVEFWTQAIPGNEQHLREGLRSYLRGKGVPTERGEDKPIVIVID